MVNFSRKTKEIRVGLMLLSFFPLQLFGKSTHEPNRVRFDQSFNQPIHRSFPIDQSTI